MPLTLTLSRITGRGDRRRLCVLAGALSLTGCVQRQLHVVSDPPGAVVYLNDREMGRTPFTHEFLWYGNYDVVARKDGYETLKTIAPVNAPFWQFVPFDAVTDFLPLRDDETISIKLKPQGPVDLNAVMARGLETKGQLESSEHTVQHSVMNVRPTTQFPSTFNSSSRSNR